METLLGSYLTIEPLEAGFARRFRGEAIGRFLELGGGSGRISRLLAPDGVRCLLLDLNVTDWDAHHRPAAIGDLRSVPVRPASFDAAAAVNCLYFLADPVVGIRQAYEALKPGGIFLASSPGRYHDPELADVVPDWGQRGPFDAEEAAGLVASVFGEVEEDWWEVPAYHLPDRAAVVDYLVAFGVPEPEVRAERLPVPLDITKKGANVWACRG